MQKENIKTVIKGFGLLLSILSVGFVIYKLSGSWQQLGKSLLDGPEKFILIYLSIFYGASQILISRGWHILLQHYHGQAIAFWPTHKINAQTQIAKYLPSNLLHVAGRIVLGQLLGIRKAVLAKASIDEALLLALSATLISSVCFFQSNIAWSFVTQTHLFSLMLFMALLIFLKLLLQRSIEDKTISEVHTQHITYYAYSFAHYLLFILIACIINTVFANEILAFTNAGKVFEFFAIYALAWLIGFVTPGAPGGIGVREAVLLLTLSSQYGEANSLLIALASRIISTIGDVTFFCSALPIKKLRS